MARKFEKSKARKCKGFGVMPCTICYRQDDNSADTIVRALREDTETGRMFCNYWIGYGHYS